MNTETNMEKAGRLLCKHYNENYILKPADYLSPNHFVFTWFNISGPNFAGVAVSPYYHLEQTKFQVFYDGNEGCFHITALKRVASELIENV